MLGVPAAGSLLGRFLGHRLHREGQRQPDGRPGRRAGQPRLHQDRRRRHTAGAAGQRVRRAGQARQRRQDRARPGDDVDGQPGPQDLHVRPHRRRDLHQRREVHRRGRRLQHQPGQEGLDHLAEVGDGRRPGRQGGVADPAEGDAVQAEQRLALPDDDPRRGDVLPDRRRQAGHRPGRHRPLQARPSGTAATRSR